MFFLCDGSCVRWPVPPRLRFVYYATTVCICIGTVSAGERRGWVELSRHVTKWRRDGEYVCYRVKWSLHLHFSAATAHATQLGHPDVHKCEAINPVSTSTALSIAVLVTFGFCFRFVAGLVSRSSTSYYLTNNLYLSQSSHIV